MWHGLLVDIPNGWALCDGSNGTPDLRDRYVRGSSDGVDPGGTGGVALHSHGIQVHTKFTTPNHIHLVSGNTGYPPAGDDDYASEDGEKEVYDVHYHSISFNTQAAGGRHNHYIDDPTNNHSSHPPYYDIAYIMKL